MLERQPYPIKVWACRCKTTSSKNRLASEGNRLKTHDRPLSHPKLTVWARQLLSLKARPEHRVTAKTCSKLQLLNRKSPKTRTQLFRNSKEQNKQSSHRTSLSTKKTSWSSSTVTRSTPSSWKYSKKEKPSTPRWSKRKTRSAATLPTRGFQWVQRVPNQRRQALALLTDRTTKY